MSIQPSTWASIICWTSSKRSSSSHNALQLKLLLWCTTVRHMYCLSVSQYSKIQRLYCHMYISYSVEMAIQLTDFQIYSSWSRAEHQRPLFLLLILLILHLQHQLLLFLKLNKVHQSLQSSDLWIHKKKPKYRYLNSSHVYCISIADSQQQCIVISITE